MGDVFPVFSVNANVPMHIPPHLSPSPLGDLVLAWLKLGRAVSVFCFLFFFLFAFLLFFGVHGWAEGFLRGWAGSPVFGLACVFGIRCWAGERCCYWFEAGLEFELGLGFGLLTGLFGGVYICSIVDLRYSVYILVDM